MPIADPRYLLFLLSSLALFYILPPGKWRMIFIVCASYAYYSTFKLYFLLVIIGMTWLTYIGGILIGKYRNRHGSIVITLVIISAVLPMIVFKILSVVPDVMWIYPVGLSFFTFTSLAYLIDVYLDVVDVEVKPLRIALACAFFPVVTLGPLIRTSFYESLNFSLRLDSKRFIKGLSEVVLGIVLKISFADVLALNSDSVYSNIYTTSGIEQFLASVVEAFQIYADWQGYSLIAIGSARLFGIDFPQNFRQPYLSTNIGEFWRSWHVALVNWFRDYIFMPLRLLFKNQSKIAVPFATLITFTLLGAWHVNGSASYVFYGIINGIMLIYSQQTFSFRNAIWAKIGIPLFLLNPFRVITTFFMIVLTVPLARSQSLEASIHIYENFLSFPNVLNGFFKSHMVWDSKIFPYIDVERDFLLIFVIICGDAVALLKGRGCWKEYYFLLDYAVLIFGSIIIFIYFINKYSAKPFVYFRY